ncbi:hypothetical protein MB02_08055 [Croceicoccus estronivorus]|uniref:hypothetical protein n=1 Tax=Croceicoccus estronivorus TaxID=1172626 RepID=UPI00083612C9|nr:hypothetical protein [Croceicoccus estronivorus]OCC24204.1 hypothetical protein MB02_08055 [Croceicoccus estronivorus]
MDHGHAPLFGLELPGAIHRRGHSDRQVFVSRLSADECRLSGENLDLHAGDRVDLSFSTIGPFTADVHSTEQGTACVRLVPPLHPAIVQHFAAFVHLAE